MQGLTTPTLSKDMLKASYWPKARHIEQPKNMPRGIYDNMRPQIFDVYSKTKRDGIDPIPIQDGEPLPRIKGQEAMLKLVIDELQSTATNGLVRHFVRPAHGAGRRLKQAAFDAAAQPMIDDPWYSGRRIQHIQRVTDDGWHVTHQLTRRAAYVVPVGGSQGGWFKGVNAASMRGQVESLAPPLTALRNREEECFAGSVGDVTVHNPEDSILHNLMSERLNVRILTKVSAAFLYLV